MAIVEERGRHESRGRVTGELMGHERVGCPPEPVEHAAGEGRHAQHRQKVTSLSSALNSPRDLSGRSATEAAQTATRHSGAPTLSNPPLGRSLSLFVWDPVFCGTRLSTSQRPMDAA